MKRIIPAVPAVIMLLCISVAAYADTILLNDGTSVEGTVVDESPEAVTVKIKFGQVTYKKSEIKEIKKSGVAAAETGVLRDVVKLKSGEEHQGLLVSQDDKEIVFDLIMSGKALSKTMVTQTHFPREEIAETRLLTEKQRSQARASLSSVAEQEVLDAYAEKSVNITSIDWPSIIPNKTIPAKKIELDFFSIESDTNDDFLRKAAFRLSKVFNAYKQHFGADRNLSFKVRVIILNSMEEYQAAIGNSIKNPAFYSPDRKMIAAGCDVAKYEFLVTEIKKYHAQLDQQLEAYKRQISNARTDLQQQVAKYQDMATAGGKGMTAESRAMMDSINQQKIKFQLQLGEMEKAAKKVQDEIFSLNRRNDVVFNDYTKQMFATLYHEGFHAFLHSFLFPENQVDFVPRWLNEGLAQYFEASRIENDRFILGQEDREKMALLRKFRKDGGIIPLDKLVNGGQEDYIVHDITNLERSTKNYLQAWLLVHWLGENKRLNKETLQAYVKALVEKKPALEALSILSGVPNAQLEQELDQKLKPTFEQQPEKK